MSFFNGDMKITELNVGSDSPGDMYYRNSSNKLARIPVGTDNQVLTLAGTVPGWETASGGGGGGVSLTGSTDNTVCTVTGTDSIACESNLTFNGSHLTIKNGLSFPKLTTTTDSSGNQTYSASEMVGGIIIRTYAPMPILSSRQFSFADILSSTHRLLSRGHLQSPHQFISYSCLPSFCNSLQLLAGCRKCPHSLERILWASSYLF